MFDYTAFFYNPRLMHQGVLDRKFQNTVPTFGRLHSSVITRLFLSPSTIQLGSGARSRNRTQVCRLGEVDAGDFDDGLPSGFLAGAIVEVWLALRLNRA